MALDRLLRTGERRLTAAALVERVARLLNDALLLVHALLHLLIDKYRYIINYSSDSVTLIKTQYMFCCEPADAP